VAPERPEARNPEGSARGPEGETAPGREHEGYASAGDPSAAQDPDVLLDVPALSVEELHLEVENLKARISVQAELAELVKLNVGVDVDLGKVKLSVKGLDAQVLLKVKLDNIRAILEQAMEAIDRDPSILDRLTGETNRKDREPGGDGRPRDRDGTAGEAEQTVRRTVDEKGNVLKTVVDGSGDVLEENASGDLADLPLEEEYLDDEGRLVGRARDDAGNVVEEELDDAGNVVGFLGFVGANEAGRREATEAAERKAQEMGVDLSEVDGTGSGGRILLRDVKKAAKNGR
jgi:pyruvate/2-oxoglutarate dehydrogenase complex dihydrolipoamide acyltransferase (E2) component